MQVLIQPVAPADRSRAEALAEETGLPLAGAEPGRASGAPSEDMVLLLVSHERLALRAPAAGEREIVPDIGHLGTPRRGRDDLLRAVLPSASGGRSDGFRVADLTAGMGTDGFLIAAAGAEVDMIERSAVLYVLLRDALARALRDPETARAAARIALHHGDARTILPRLAGPEVAYLDPMYPDLGKSARKNKEMHLFRSLVGDDPDAGDLLDAALAAAKRRVVVKRPAKAPPLGGRPTGAIRGRSVRFDLYPPGE